MWLYNHVIIPVIPIYYSVTSRVVRGEDLNTVCADMLIFANYMKVY